MGEVKRVFHKKMWILIAVAVLGNLCLFLYSELAGRSLTEMFFAAASHNVSLVRVSLKPSPAPISPAPITSTGFCLFECIWNKCDTRSFLPERVL